MKDIFLNDFHRQRYSSKRLQEQISKQPKTSLEDAMKQYDRIKQGSSRRKADQSDCQTKGLSGVFS